MCGPSQTFFITSWDLRLLWTLPSIFLRGYFFVLVASGVFILGSVIRVLHMCATSAGLAPLPDKTLSALRNRFRLLSLLLLCYAAVMSREVLSCIHGVRLSLASLSEFYLEDQLEAPVAFCLVSMLIFTFLYGLLWLTESRVARAQFSKSR